MESHARRRLSGLLLAVTLSVCATGIALAAAGRVEQTGVFALVGGTPKVVSKFWVSHASGLSGTLKVRQFSDGKPILDYDVDMEHTMHMVIVRDDFATFAHVHPDFDTTTGTFWQNFTREPNHRYYVYADSTPHGIGQQVFRFTMDADGPLARSQPSLNVSPPITSAGPYSVKLSKTTLHAGRPKNLYVTVLENGKPAEDLAPYLGAAAHAVFINTSTLAYIHIHPTIRGESTNTSGDMTGAMGGGTTGPFMQMAVPALPAGTYKLWLQFLGNGTVYTAPFTLLAR